MLASTKGVVRVPGCSHPDGVTLCGLDRARARVALYQVLPFGPAQAMEAATYAIQVEACAALQAGGRFDEYAKIMWRLRYNLARNGRHVVETIPVHRVCRVGNRRLQAENTSTARSRKTAGRVKTVLAQAKAEADKASAMAASVASEMAVRCPKCKTQDNIHRMTMQRNAGDEGMKTKCLCTCGHKWELAG
jgi:DNA-directed RNA polymerase subunit M/transcription elongation factor TFIIS